MLSTPVCQLLGIDVPVLCAAFGPWEEVALAAAVCEAGGMGSLGSALSEGAVGRAAPADGPPVHAAVRRGHLAVPPDLIARAHDAGIVWIQQVLRRPSGRRGP
jgi:nitronate monooxygenase/enoyl-[acyl-carrier protein] reductase II